MRRLRREGEGKKIEERGGGRENWKERKRVEEGIQVGVGKGREEGMEGE